MFERGDLADGDFGDIDLEELQDSAEGFAEAFGGEGSGTVEVNGETVIEWDAEPRGKVEDFAARGFIGLQNHDRDTRTFFRNIFVKSLD